MSASDKNPPIHQQKQEFKESPVKRPATETAHMDAVEIPNAIKLARGGNKALSKDNNESCKSNFEENNLKNKNIIGDDEIQSIDSFNDHSLDNTVDTDGKNKDAQKLPVDVNQVIGSNATLKNSISVKSQGLAGYDSRPNNNLPRILANKNSKIIYEGMLNESDLDFAQLDAFKTKKNHSTLRYDREGYKVKIE